MSGQSAVLKNQSYGVNYLSKYGKYYGKELQKLASKGLIDLVQSNILDYSECFKNETYEDLDDYEKVLYDWEMDDLWFNS